MIITVKELKDFLELCSDDDTVYIESANYHKKPVQILTRRVNHDQVIMGSDQ